MMRTSPSQFEQMVDFMERNGDLNKPADGPNGRLNSIQKWAELCTALNVDFTGSTRSVEKWKKVWSDLKNNTKRKAAKIHRCTVGTGGGPACKLVLTDLEQRVLNIIGSQAATGLVMVDEVGDELVAPSKHVTPPPLPPNTLPLLIEPTIEITRTETSGQTTPFAEVENAVSLTPEHAHVVTPTGRSRRTATSRRQLTPRRRRVRPTGSRLESVLDRVNSQTDQWQALMRELVTEHLRQRDVELKLREAELQQHAQWQTLFAKFLAYLEK